MNIDGVGQDEFSTLGLEIQWLYLYIFHGPLLDLIPFLLYVNQT